MHRPKATVLAGKEIPLKSQAPYCRKTEGAIILAFFNNILYCIDFNELFNINL